MINLLSKQDLITDMVGEIIKWSSNLPALENAIASSTDGESYALISNILHSLLWRRNDGKLSLSNATADAALLPIPNPTGTPFLMVISYTPFGQDQQLFAYRSGAYVVSSTPGSKFKTAAKDPLFVNLI